MKKMEYKTRQWHEKCFVCCTCKNPIGTKSFIPKENDIYCAKCYEEKFATKCIKCGKVRRRWEGGRSQVNVSGDHTGRGDLQERPLAQGVLHLHPLPEVPGRTEIHLQG